MPLGKANKFDATAGNFRGGNFGGNQVTMSLKLFLFLRHSRYHDNVFLGKFFGFQGFLRARTEIYPKKMFHKVLYLVRPLEILLVV